MVNNLIYKIVAKEAISMILAIGIDHGGYELTEVLQ